VLPVDLATAIRATELPSIHADPVDRMVIAAAQLQSLTVVTSDRVFDRYDVETIL
jgi:PIN domain nuclease of toxin-antitoxin system